MNNPYVGEVTCFGFKYVPAGWIPCRGQMVSIDQHKQLYSVLGTTFGGDGLAYFGVPNFPTMTDEGGLMCISPFGVPPNESRHILPGELAIFPYPGNPPSRWISCNGQLLQISQHNALFKILGKTFGGDGITTFAMPMSHYLPPLGSGAGPIFYAIPDAPGGSNEQGFQGEIKFFPATVPPPGWLPCNGRLLTIADNPPLFSLLGVDYGGDGRTTFALPDITAGAYVKGLQAFICHDGVWPQRP